MVTPYLGRGAWSDAESLLKYHWVDPAPDATNPHNIIHLTLPAAPGADDDLSYGIDRNREWRRLLG